MRDKYEAYDPIEPSCESDSSPDPLYPKCNHTVTLRITQMTKQITSEVLLVVANGVESEHEWGFHKDFLAAHIPYCKKKFTFYVPLEDCDKGTAQQLRIRDFLAEKGVLLRQEIIDPINKEKIFIAFYEQKAGAITSHEKINDCAILAAYAVITGEG